jgi:hypothetical protein
MRLAADSGRQVVVVDPAGQEDPARRAAMLAAAALGLASETSRRGAPGSSAPSPSPAAHGGRI